MNAIVLSLDRMYSDVIADSHFPSTIALCNVMVARVSPNWVSNAASSSSVSLSEILSAINMATADTRAVNSEEFIKHHPVLAYEKRRKKLTGIAERS